MSRNIQGGFCGYEIVVELKTLQQPIHKNQLLESLLQEIPAELFINLPQNVKPDVKITGISLDSRKVEAGNIFFAIKGGDDDGLRHIPQALEKGASLIVSYAQLGEVDFPYIQVKDVRAALAYFSAAYFHHPAMKMVIIGVTGTDGKTTTANYLYHVLRAAQISTGMISTVNAVIGNQVVDTGYHVTTPQAPDLQAYLANMAFLTCPPVSHVILESTSHGLDQHRVTACEFDIGVITNLSHEHLDYHGSYESYRNAKARLFQLLAQTKSKKAGNIRLAVLNRDDSSYIYLSQLTKDLKPTVRQVSYGIHPDADLQASQIGYQGGKLTIEMSYSGKRIKVQTNLLGKYNASNCLAAASVAFFGLGIDPEIVCAGIADLESVPGRMELIDMGQEFAAVVDFAHTPNALKNALIEARQFCSGRVIAVFGSAGLRDRDKRYLMAEASASLADITILTAEDPRTESLNAILVDMVAGIQDRGGKEKDTYWRVPDRREAITLAVNMAKPGDIVMVMGKGHEQSMCFGEIEYPWDDRVALRAALASNLGIHGPEMPFLPDTT